MARRIIAARHYQRDDDPTLRISRKAMLPVARELRHAFNSLSDMVHPKAVAEALRHTKHPMHVINTHHYREVLRGPFARLGKLRQAGGELGARKINGVFAAKRRKVRFHKSASIAKGKASKLEANYRRATDSRKRCGDCWMFQAPQACCAVEGIIHVWDTCDFFESIWIKPEQETAVVKATGNQFSFDSFSPDIQRQARQEQDRLIQQLEDDARDTINQVIRDGILNGDDVDTMAENIKEVIGLTDTQAQAVLNYQRMLENLDSTALQRQLRNTDYDAQFLDAIDSGTDLADAVVASMVEDYIDNYLDYRAATIAQTESTRAANLGLHDAYDQAVDRGAIPEEAITRQWQLGDSPCPICESIPANNPDGVGLNDDFDSDDGPIDDPPVHPNCECSVDYVTDLTLVPDDESDDEETPGPGSFGVGGIDTPYMDDDES